MSGVRDDTVAIWLAAATSFVNFIFTFVGVWLVERMGRRLLILISIAGKGLLRTVRACVGSMLEWLRPP